MKHDPEKKKRKSKGDIEGSRPSSSLHELEFNGWRSRWLVTSVSVAIVEE